MFLFFTWIKHPIPQHLFFTCINLPFLNTTIPSTGGLYLQPAVFSLVQYRGLCLSWLPGGSCRPIVSPSSGQLCAAVAVMLPPQGGKPGHLYHWQYTSLYLPQGIQVNETELLSDCVCPQWWPWPNDPALSLCPGKLYRWTMSNNIRYKRCLGLWMIRTEALSKAEVMCDPL